MNTLDEHKALILIGASIRSLTATALRAGYAPFCVDLFCDSDLTWMLEEHGADRPIRISSFADAPAVVSKLPSHLPVVWAGGIENTPAVIDAISQRRKVLGPSTRAVEYVNHPQHLQTCVEGTTCQTPETTWKHPDDGSQEWLVKPIQGAGGIGIRPFRHDEPLENGAFLQRVVRGLPVSALYCHGPDGTELLTTSVQLIGTPNLGAKNMTFCGNIGPISLPRPVCRAMLEVGRRVASMGICGVFGADFVVSPNNVWLIEVNPRITASHEIPDLVLDGPSVLERHIGASPGTAQPETTERRASFRNACLARLILYAVTDVELRESDVQELATFDQAPGSRSSDPSNSGSSHSWVADIPAPSLISAGEPFCSVYHVLHRDHEGKLTAKPDPGGAEMDSLIAKYTGLKSLDTMSTAVQWMSHCESELANRSPPHFGRNSSIPNDPDHRLIQTRNL